MAAPRRFIDISLAWRLALRDFRGGIGGFWIFLACLALGLMAIVGVGSVSDSLAKGLVEQGRVILGGDISFTLVQREASDRERGFLAAHGRLSEVALMRAMARPPDKAAVLVEIKAVDRTYPAEGSVGLEPAQPLQDALAEYDGAYGVAADAAFAEKLALKQGGRFTIGSQQFELRAILTSEPDKLVGGIGFGPRLLMSEDALLATHLLQPGALVKWLYRLSLAPGETVDALTARAREAFPDAGFEIRTWRDVAPEFSRDLDRFSHFLVLVGLSSLIIGGVGVANAVRAFVDRKRTTIATLKALGAPSSFIFMLMLTEVMAMAAIGMALGIALGVALPFVVRAAVGAFIPLPFAPAIFPGEIAAGLLYGTLTSLAFSLAPLSRVHDVSVSSLFRNDAAFENTGIRRHTAIIVVLAAAALSLAVIWLAPDRRLAVIFLAASAGGFLILRGAAALIMMAARKLRQMRPVELRLAIANLHRPGTLTPSIVLSLGLGLTLVVALTLVDGNLNRTLDGPGQQKTPNYFFLGLGQSDVAEFRRLVARDAASAEIELVPMLRGRIVKVKDRPVETLKVKDDANWALQGDRGFTFSDAAPKDSKLVAGTWWSTDYKGAPLASLAADIAGGLGVGIGDRITVNVLGRNIEARIANLRKVDWAHMGINFVLIYSSNTFAGAPYSNLATVRFSSNIGGNSSALVGDVTKAFPDVVSLRVRDALDAVKDVLNRLVLAVRAAAAVALLTATLVLGGALAAGQRARLYDAVVLKTLGATRARVLLAYVCEFGLIGLTTAVFGILAGGVAALAVVRLVMKLDFIWLWPQALASAGAVVFVAVVLGLLGTWHVLGRKPAQYLRNL